MVGTMSRERRKSAFKREKDKIFEPNERDVEILKYVYRYRFLHTQHLLAITGIKHVQTLNLRLRKLYDNKYLDRPNSQVADWQIGKGKTGRWFTGLVTGAQNTSVLNLTGTCHQRDIKPKKTGELGLCLSSTPLRSLIL